MEPVQPAKQRLRCSLAARGDEVSALVRIKIGNWIFPPRVDDGAAVLTGQKGGIPIFRPIGGEAAMIGQHDKGRQILVLSAKAIADPGAHARKTRELKPSGLKVSGLAMDSGLSDDIVNKCYLIYHLPQVRNDIT